ncbi:MAG: hypothetical protein H6733_13085 [Alphaproteobacteria bacterium]|nr:hypothetical protein [Alphaproteobacteria bacterium]
MTARILPLIFMTACLIPATRDQYVSDITFDVCTEKVQCGRVDKDDEDAEYTSFDDCTADVEALFRNVWPSDTCDADSIDRDAYEDCHHEALTAACSDGFFDGLSAIEACNANAVCSD